MGDRPFAITKWHTLVASLWVALACGYWGTFGTFSPALRKKYGLDPGDISTIGIGTTVVGFVTFTCGLYTDRIGITIALLTGVFINMVGWFLYGLIAINHLEPMSPVVMFTGLAVFATYGAGILTSVVFKVLANNFTSEDRSSVIGIAKAWVGVTSGFTSTVYRGFFPGEDDAPERLYFVWFVVLNIAIFALLPAPLMRIVPKEVEGNLALTPRVRVLYLLTITLVLIALTVVISLAQSSLTNTVTMALGLVLISVVVLPWLSLLPARGTQNRSSSLGGVALVESAPEEQQLALEAGPERAESPWAGGPLDMMSRPDSWLLWFNVFAMMAGGVVLTTNFGLITSSRSGAKVDSATAVSLFSAAQALGRLTGGVLSDFVVRRRLPRPAYFVVISLGMAGAHACLCIPGQVAFYVGTLIAGYTFGSTYPLMIVTIVELFGAERIASNYMIFDGTPVGVASLLVAKFFTQWVLKQNTVGDKCVGDSCFTLVYVGVIGLQAIAILCACLLTCRSKAVYASISNSA